MVSVCSSLSLLRGRVKSETKNLILEMKNLRLREIDRTCFWSLIYLNLNFCTAAFLSIHILLHVAISGVCLFFVNFSLNKYLVEQHKYKSVYLQNIFLLYSKLKFRNELFHVVVGFLIFQT